MLQSPTSVVHAPNLCWCVFFKHTSINQLLAGGWDWWFWIQGFSLHKRGCRHPGRPKDCHTRWMWWKSPRSCCRWRRSTLISIPAALIPGRIRAARSTRSWHVDSASWMKSWGNRGPAGRPKWQRLSERYVDICSRQNLIASFWCWFIAWLSNSMDVKQLWCCTERQSQDWSVQILER